MRHLSAEQPHFESPQEKNLELNFPSHTESITFNNIDEILGSNYGAIMRQVKQLPDTFGLCGVIAGHGLGILVNPDKWKQFIYDIKSMKASFDSKMNTGQGKDAFSIFRDTYYHGGFNNKAIQTERELVDVYRNLQSDEGLLVSVLCSYPQHQGTHTHWLATKMNNDSITVVGDLTPFGLESIGIEVSPETLSLAMKNVIGAGPTSSLSENVARVAESEGRSSMTENGVFTMNASIWNRL